MNHNPGPKMSQDVRAIPKPAALTPSPYSHKNRSRSLKMTLVLETLDPKQPLNPKPLKNNSPKILTPPKKKKLKNNPQDRIGNLKIPTP